MPPMKVVYTPRHRAHDVTEETYLGVVIPANEVAERAETIRDALVADGGFELVDPTEHGLDPILAVHDPGLVRFVEEAWPQARREAIGRTFLVADTYPVRAMFEGMSRAALGPASGAAGRSEAGPAGGVSIPRTRSSPARTRRRGGRSTSRSRPPTSCSAARPPPTGSAARRATTPPGRWRAGTASSTTPRLPPRR